MFLLFSVLAFLEHYLFMFQAHGMGGRGHGSEWRYVEFEEAFIILHVDRSPPHQRSNSLVCSSLKCAISA